MNADPKFAIIPRDCSGLATFVSEENKPENDFEVYPNPSAGVFQVSPKGVLWTGLKSKVNSLEIYDATGRLVKTAHLEQGTFDLSAVESGVYFLRLFNDNASDTKPILIQK